MDRAFWWQVGAVLFAAIAAGGCVVQSHYVKTRDALVREQAGHHETASQLRDTGERLIAAERERDLALSELQAGKQHIRLAEQRLAQLELDIDVAAQKRQEATQLVEQLQGELGRAAGHLQTFSAQRDALRAALDAAEDKLHRLADVEREAVKRAVVLRDLALALHQPVATGEVELVVVDGRPVLRVPAARVFPAATPENVDPDGDAVLAAVAKVAQAHPGVVIHVTETGVVEAPGAAEARLGQVSSRLIEHGVERSLVLVEVPPSE